MCISSVHLYASKVLLVFSEYFNEQKVKKNSIYVIKNVFVTFVKFVKFQ